MSEESISRRIAALLAKAESTNFDGERDALIDKASELAEKYSISMAYAFQSGGGQDEVVEIEIDLETSAWLGFKAMATDVGMAYGFHVLYRKTPDIKRQRPQILWIGWKSDIEIAEAVYASLLTQCARAQARHLDSMVEEFKLRSEIDGKKPGWHRFTEGRSFIVGFGSAVATRIAEARRLAQKEAEDDQPGTGLVLASREDLLDEGFRKLHPYVGRGRASRQQMTGSGLAGGGAAGRNADTGGPRMGGRKALGS